MKALLAIAAALLAPSLAGTAAGAQTAPEARSIGIPFDPPLGRRLVYRGERVGIGETTPRNASFALEFERADEGFIMTVWRSVDRPPPVGTDPALVRQRFSLSSDGHFVAMLDEAAYWRAIEALLQADARAAPGDRDAEGALWAMRRQRDLPTRERLHALAHDAVTPLYFAGAPILTGAERRGERHQETVVGRIASEEREVVETVDDDRVRIRRTRAMPVSTMTAAMEELRLRYGRSLPGMGGRVVANETISSYDVDRRTGLVRAFRLVQTTTTEHEGERRTAINSETLRLAE